MSVASRTILSNFFEEQCPQSHPQYLSGLSRALFPTTFLEIAVNTNETPGELSREVKRSPLLWLHSKSTLSLKKKIEVEWFGISLVFQ